MNIFRNTFAWFVLAGTLLFFNLHLVFAFLINSSGSVERFGEDFILKCFLVVNGLVILSSPLIFWSVNYIQEGATKKRLDEYEALISLKIESWLGGVYVASPIILYFILTITEGFRFSNGSNEINYKTVLNFIIYFNLVGSLVIRPLLKRYFVTKTVN